jgi:hypothetical protein
MRQQTQQPQNNGNAKPDLIAKVKEHNGNNESSFVTIGAAWTREDGSIYFKPYGKQIIDGPIYLFQARKS